MTQFARTTLTRAVVRKRFTLKRLQSHLSLARQRRQDVSHVNLVRLNSKVHVFRAS
jgi:hypothetical protein